MDICSPATADLEQIATTYGLHPQMVSDCLDQGHLPKIQKEGAVNFLILRAYDECAPLDATTVQECTRKLALFWGDGFLLTVHRVPMPWLTKVIEKRSEKSGKKAPSIKDLIEELAEECLYTYEAPIDGAAVEIEKLEEEIFKDKSSPVTSNSILETAYLAKKRATIFKRMLRLTRDLLPLISRTDVKFENSARMQSLKEEADRLYIYSDDLVETAHDLVELSISLTTNRTNEVVRVLTIVSIFVLPLNVITGIYGMNFEIMPELKQPWGYGATLVGMLGLSAIIYILLKKKGWIR